MFYYYMFIVKPQFQQKIQKYSTLEFSAFPFSICRLRQAVLLGVCSKHNRRDNAAETIWSSTYLWLGFSWASSCLPASLRICSWEASCTCRKHTYLRSAIEKVHPIKDVLFVSSLLNFPIQDGVNSAFQIWSSLAPNLPGRVLYS